MGETGRQTTGEAGRVTTAAELTVELHRVGIRAGDNLILHSSLKSLGRVDGGAPAVVDAVLDAIGPDGNLMVPTFTYSMPMWKAEPFDIRATKSRVGAITEAVRMHPLALRSFHPTHSVAVIGPDAEAIIRNHLHATPIGLESPFGRMRERGARILMLGTTQDTNSSLHYCEVASGLPYVQVAFSAGRNFELAWFLNEQGQAEYTQLFELPGCSRGFRAIEAPLIDRGALHPVTVAGALSQFLDMEEMVKAVDEILKTDPAILLCFTPNCSICPKRRAFTLRHLP
jgi:aminoglycoside 3-N-acetyltransferase